MILDGRGDGVGWYSFVNSFAGGWGNGCAPYGIALDDVTFLFFWRTHFPVDNRLPEC